MSRGCRLSPTATLRLQGVCASDLVLPSNDGHVRNLAGNAMSLCVVERLLRGALLAIGVHKSGLPDRWASGIAQAELIREAGGEHPPATAVADMPGFVVRHFVVGPHVQTEPLERRHHVHHVRPHLRLQPSSSRRPHRLAKQIPRNLLLGSTNINMPLRVCRGVYSRHGY